MPYRKVDTAVQQEHTEHVRVTEGVEYMHTLAWGHLFFWLMGDCARYKGGRVARVIKFVNDACGLVWEGLYGNRIKHSN